MSEQKNISEYGFNFQVKFIVCLITDKLFLEQIYDILDEKYLGNDAFKWLVKEIKEHYSKYKKVMTMDVFKVQVGEVDNDLLKQNILDTLREVVKHLESEELDYIKDKALDFHKTQVLKDAILRSAQILEVDGDVEQIKVIIDDAMKAGMKRDIGHDYLQDFEERYSETARVTTPTPWDLMNELMQGGLGAGELGVVVAPAGIGKSWVLSAIRCLRYISRVRMLFTTP